MKRHLRIVAKDGLVVSPPPQLSVMSDEDRFGAATETNTVSMDAGELFLHLHRLSELAFRENKNSEVGELLHQWARDVSEFVPD